MYIRYGASRYGQTGFRSNSPLSDEVIAKYAPSVFAPEAHASRGERYAFIPTSQVLDALRGEGFQPYEVRQTRVRDEAKRDHTKHMIRLRHASNLAKGDETPEIILVNSHDGSSSYQLMAGVFRMVCSNGLIAGDVAENIRIRHTGNVVGEVIEGSYRVLDSLSEVNERIDLYKSTRLTASDQLAFAEAAKVLRWDDKVPIRDASQLLSVRRMDDKRADAWTTFNVVQENLIRGGLYGRSANGRRSTTRAVNGVNEDVRLNKALWILADNLVHGVSLRNEAQIMCAA